MAQTVNLENAVNELLKSYQPVFINAAQKATEMTMKEFVDKAYFELDKYYNSYEPNSYKRTHSLLNCIVPFSKVNVRANRVNCTLRIDYDSSKLHYDQKRGEGKPSRFYRGEKVENKITPKDFSPINEFVLNNFLEGRHTTTSGSSKVNTPMEFIQTKAIGHYMDNYVMRDLEEIFAQNFMFSLIDQLKLY